MACRTAASTLGGLDDLARAQAARADADALDAAVDHRPHRLQVRLEPARAHVVGVADAAPDDRPFPQISQRLAMMHFTLPTVLTSARLSGCLDKHRSIAWDQGRIGCQKTVLRHPASRDNPGPSVFGGGPIRRDCGPGFSTRRTSSRNPWRSLPSIGPTRRAASAMPLSAFAASRSSGDLGPCSSATTSSNARRSSACQLLRGQGLRRRLVDDATRGRLERPRHAVGGLRDVGVHERTQRVGSDGGRRLTGRGRRTATGDPSSRPSPASAASRRARAGVSSRPPDACVRTPGSRSRPDTGSRRAAWCRSRPRRCVRPSAGHWRLAGRA